MRWGGSVPVDVSPLGPMQPGLSSCCHRTRYTAGGVERCPGGTMDNRSVVLLQQGGEGSVYPGRSPRGRVDRSHNLGQPARDAKSM